VQKGTSKIRDIGQCHLGTKAEQRGRIKAKRVHEEEKIKDEKYQILRVILSWK
jgi:hypothetical protein